MILILVPILILTVTMAVPQHKPGGEEFNCFELVDKSQWSDIIGLDISTASLSVHVERSVRTCLNRQMNKQTNILYRIRVVGDQTSQMYLSPTIHNWEGGPGDLASSSPTFPYLIYGGRYRLQITFCPTGASCSPSATEFSDWINLQDTVKSCCSNSSYNCTYPPSSNSVSVSSDTTISKNFTFTLCSPVQEYDTANISLFQSSVRSECGSGSPLQSQLVYLQDFGGLTSVSYRSPQLEGDYFYCLSLSLSHISCLISPPHHPFYCNLQSDIVLVSSTPLISRLIPSCTTHFACTWLYITLTGSLSLLISLTLAIILVRCCHSKHSSDNLPIKPDEVDFALGPIHKERQSWTQLHKEWEVRGEDKTRGKILLLYSPDTKLFRELCEAFKSFLDLACHCDIYDLFDDALFDTIALDPSEWLQEFVNDKDVKIVVISSIGAHRRQMALRGEIPLNLPDNNILDGLFTSGLRFISTYPGLVDSGRVSTARYEMLHLTQEDHKLGPPLYGGAVREFLVPTELHELFCWVHQLEPLDIMGKPWQHYHLEMQLLQDALKVVRRDKTVTPNYTNLGNGVTRL